MQNEEMIKTIISLLKQMTEKDQNFKYVKRAAHAKSTGLLKGYFTVCENLPKPLRVGLFKEAKKFSALIRCSNSNPKFTSDKRKDIRGFAIKLLDDNQPDFPQDFILASCPTIPLGTWEEFYEALYWGLKNPIYLLLKTVLQGNINKFIAIYKMMHHDTSPLDIKYWSITPYALGDAVIKYTLLPTSAYQSRLPQTLTDSYLTENMHRHLLRHNATFDFCVQLQTDAAKMPLDDISIEWSEIDSPLIKVAELEIPAQNFKTDRRSRLLETLAYSPANSLAQHKALGSINEARIKIYQELSAFRHKKNQLPKKIPTEGDFDSLQ